MYRENFQAMNIGKARKIGFNIKEFRELLALYKDSNRPSREVKNLTLLKIAEFDEKIDELSNLRTHLANLALECHGDDRPDCPILDNISIAD
mgnify:FL=1